MRPCHGAIGAAAAILLLAGCTRTEWVKTGAEASRRDADVAACKQVAGQDGFITVYQNDLEMIDAENRFRECMKGRGYSDRAQ
jgi:hypothetical protein